MKASLKEQRKRAETDSEVEREEQCGWSLPDVIVYPTGGGTGLVGMWKAFSELQAVGLIGPRRPRLLAVQSDGCAPFVRAVEQGDRFAEPWAQPETAAAGIRVPGSVGDFLVIDCIRESNGTAAAVPEIEIRAMQARLATDGAGYTSLETAAAVLGAAAAREARLLEAGEQVVVFDTGAGFKSEPPHLDTSPPISADERDWDAAISRLGQSLS